MWPSVPMTVPDSLMGFAYGLINAANNIGLALYPFIFGAINDANTPAAYDNSMIGLSVLAALGMVGCVGAHVSAKKYDNNALDDVNVKKEKIKAKLSNDGIRSNEISNLATPVNAKTKIKASEPLKNDPLGNPNDATMSGTGLYEKSADDQALLNNH